MSARNGQAKPGLRAADRVYEEIRRGILKGSLKPGEKITEELLAERFGASRTPVRSAIVRLAADGFVDMTPRSGTVIKHRSQRDIADIYEVRALLESAAAGLAARSRTTADLDALKSLQAAMEEACRARDANECSGSAGAAGGERSDKETETPIETLSRLNKAFHHRILDACGNAVLADSAARLMDIGLITNTYTTLPRNDFARAMSDHRMLITAIEAGDPRWAEAVMRSHVFGTRNTLSKAGLPQSG
ncbi:GntR family transcriptional regulator [Fulvimarina sp. 2208YS6-2-32]|uniref:GntR family transcriptional regulator n=1 Tax=Fulvimarina uroteuthidis TaxID=3098149 RepID=A0ABU5I038_9HYPH|nr:GntR family transcriptional regulator [Fulvimarina sp. 2208YS6-2-32]MDY8108754.1 GntR family transcriptional regulator [Fulvimarina sp. 2208YS6-2-32]